MDTYAVPPVQRRETADDRASAKDDNHQKLMKDHMKDTIQHGDPHVIWAAYAADLAGLVEVAPELFTRNKGLSQALWSGRGEYLTAIASTRASTLAGIAEQIRLVMRCHVEGSPTGPLAMTALQNALTSLLSLAAENPRASR